MKLLLLSHRMSHLVACKDVVSTHFNCNRIISVSRYHVLRSKHGYFVEISVNMNLCVCATHFQPLYGRAIHGLVSLGASH